MQLRQTGILLLALFLFALPTSSWAKKVVDRPKLSGLSDDAFLDLVSRKAFDYFLENQHPETGLFADHTATTYSNIAGCGFGLSALCIGAERGWVKKEEAQARVLTLLKALDTKAETQYGLYYHFLNLSDCTRCNTAEISLIDNALLVAGILTAGEYFGGEVKDLAQKIYGRMQWDAFLSIDPRQPDGLKFRMTWTQEGGFSSSFWDFYTDEILLISLLAIGSPAHSVPPECFYGFKRIHVTDEQGRTFVPSWFGALFTYQYAHAWLDLRGCKDRAGVDWWANSRAATLSNRDFCIQNANRFKTYSAVQWGITSFETARGYMMHHGALPNGCFQAMFDGTVSPSGPAGSIVFTPRESLASLKALYRRYPRLWGRYGFFDSFNLDERWVSSRCYALGQGITLLMIENGRSGFMWKVFMRNGQVREAMLKAGLR